MPLSPWMTHAGLDPPPEVKLEEEYRPHFAAWKAAPSPEATGRLLKTVHPVLESGIKAYGGGNANPMLRSRAKRIAIDALGSYDPARGPLKPHLLSHLQGLQRFAARQAQVLSVPARVAMDKARLDEGERHLADALGRPASDGELADHTGLGLKRIAHVRAYRPGFAEGQLSGGPAGDDEARDASGIGVEQADPTAAKVALIYHELDPVGQAIVDHGFGLHGRPRLRVGQVARRLGLTPGAISQRGKRIQELLDRVDDAGVF